MIDKWMLLIELLVLVLIAYEVWATVSERRATAKRKKTVDERIVAVRQALSKGMILKQGAVVPGGTGVSEWVVSVKQWMEDTRVLLRSYSEQADLAFVYSGMIFPLTYNVCESELFVALMAKLDNLQRIMEKPDVYL